MRSRTRSGSIRRTRRSVSAGFRMSAEVDLDAIEAGSLTLNRQEVVSAYFTPDHHESFTVVRANGMNESRLLLPERDLQLLALEGDRAAISSALGRWAALDLTVRVVRGRKMRSVLGLLDEFASALQFPLYFGENRDAFDECIADLAWLPQARGIVVVVTEPDEVLAEANPADLNWLASSLAEAGQTFSEPIALSEWWDRPPVPFHIVFVGDRDSIGRALQRWPQLPDVLPNLRP